MKIWKKKTCKSVVCVIQKINSKMRLRPVLSLSFEKKFNR